MIYDKGFGSCLNCGEIIEGTLYWINTYGTVFNNAVSNVFCDSQCSLDFCEKYDIRGKVYDIEESFWIRLNQQLAKSSNAGDLKEEKNGI